MTPEPSPDLPPVAVHLQPGRLEALRDRIRREVDAGLLPSCQAAVGLDGRVVWTEAFGDATPSSRYVVFSCTKALVAGVMWQLFAEGACSPDDRVVEHFPEFGANGKEAVTIRHLLTHTGGFPAAPLGPRRWATRDSRREVMAGWRLTWEPGTRFEYHPTAGHWVLGELIERLDGRPVGDAIAARITRPLGLADTQVGGAGAAERVAHLVAVGSFPSPADLQAAFGVDTFDEGEVTPEALLGFDRPEVLELGVPGGGGVSTAADLARYYQALLHDPAGLWTPAWLAEGTAVAQTTLPDPLLGIPSFRTLGLILAGDDGRSALRGMGHTVSPRAFGHNGAGGQIAWADPETGLSFAYLTNGIDRDFLRQARRTSGIASRAAVLLTAD